jgi:hypothetical protein
MSQINPFTGAVAQSPQVQRLQAAEKDRHLRRTQELAKATGLSTDQFEHQVESADALSTVHDDGSGGSPGQQSKEHKPDEDTSDGPPAAADPSRLDITG